MGAAEDVTALRQNITRLDTFLNGLAGTGVILSDGTTISSLLGLVGSSTGSVAPAVTWPGRHWIDTTTPAAPLLKVRDEADAAWITLDIVGLQKTAFDSVADVEAASIPAVIDKIGVLGYGAPGDGGHATYVRAGSEPTHDGKVQSADGTWWELEAGPNGAWPEQLGAVGAGVSDDAAAIRRWVGYCSAVSRHGVARGTYRMDTTATIPDPDNVHIDARGSLWSTPSDILMFDVNGRADPTYVDNESRQNFTWFGGEFRCTNGSPTVATAFRMLGMRKAILMPDKVEGFASGLMLGGKDTVIVGDIKFYDNDIDVLFPPWSIVGGPLLYRLRDLHHSHGGKTTPCIKSYVPLQDSSIMGGSYNLGSASTCVAADLQKVVLLAVSGGSGAWTPGETVTGATSGATVVLDEVYDHPFAFQISQHTRYLVGTDRTGTFVAGETVTGGTSGATAAIGSDTAAHIVQNPTWRGFEFGGASHFEAGTGANGATGIRLRDRIRQGATTFQIQIDVGSLSLNGGGSVGVEFENVKDASIRGYFAQDSGNTSVKLDADCERIEIARPFTDIGATIDLNGMARSELKLGAFDRVVAPTSFGAGGSISAGATAATSTAISSGIRSPVGGLNPVAYDLRVSLLGSTSSSGTNVRWRAFATGETAAASKQSLQIAGRPDSEYNWATMRVAADTDGDFEWDAQNTGGGTVTVNPQIVGVHYS